MSKESYRYFAFISYSSKDQKVANRLQKQIETYRLPTVTRNELEKERGGKYPKRLKPLFRDMTDLGAGVLGKSILRELEDSKYLIVVCSPNSAQSDWVNQEIENFILMGRYERIILYIIDGVPNSGDPATEAFSPILRKKREYLKYDDYTAEENADRQARLHEILDSEGELKGVSITAEGKRIARLKVIARMLEVKPDDLIQRDKQRQRRIFWQSFSAIFAFLLIATFVGLHVWDKYYRIHVAYFTDYVERWGVPEGIFELEESQTLRRRYHYRIHTQNKRVLRLEHVNSVGTPMPVNNSELKDRPMIATYSYDKESGKLTRMDSLNRNGKVLLSYTYSKGNLNVVDLETIAESGDFKGSVLPATLSNVTSIDSDITAVTTKSEIGRIVYQRNDKGEITNASFYKKESTTPAKDADGIAGFKYGLDDLGRVVEKTYLDVEGKPCPTKNGVARRTYEYDEAGNLTVAKYWDQNGNLTFNEQGWMHCINTFNEKGNCENLAFFDAKGNLCLCVYSVAGYNATYDERGNMIECAYFGVDGEPCLHKDGVAGCKSTYDERGNMIECAFFGVDGKPCLCLEGYSRYVIEYDAEGTMVRTAFYGVNDEPLNSRILVNRVIPEFQAEQLGLMADDIFLFYNGNICDDAAQFINGRKLETGDQARKLVVLRGEEILEFDVSPGLLGAGIGATMLSEEKIRSVEAKYQEMLNNNEIEISEELKGE